MAPRPALPYVLCPRASCAPAGPAPSRVLRPPPGRPPCPVRRHPCRPVRVTRTARPGRHVGDRWFPGHPQLSPLRRAAVPARPAPRVSRADTRPPSRRARARTVPPCVPCPRASCASRAPARAVPPCVPCLRVCRAPRVPRPRVSRAPAPTRGPRPNALARPCVPRPNPNVSIAQSCSLNSGKSPTFACQLRNRSRSSPGGSPYPRSWPPARPLPCPTFHEMSEEWPGVRVVSAELARKIGATRKSGCRFCAPNFQLALNFQANLPRSADTGILPGCARLPRHERGRLPLGVTAHG
jgi:hypothetical protein